MSLASGTRIGPYEIHSLLGVGGMGEVHRATDTKLKRQVAIKILPASFVADPDRLARFHREAELLAALNHPHIAAIYGLEDTGPTTALVMELVEGPTLEQLLADRPDRLPTEEALGIARQIAEALETAHAQGIVHRDLKPSNIKVRPDGTIKVLDFGLAKAVQPADASSAGSHGATLTSPAMTGLGLVLGTAAYMSPEQARGKPVDKRTDIWSFGVVLFEMFSGARLFTGDDVSDTMAYVLTKEPDWSALAADTPRPIRTLLRRCLQKDRTKRLADIADARLEIDEALNAPQDVSDPAAVKVPAPTPRWQRTLPWTVAAVALASALATLMAWAPWRAQPVAPRTRVTADLGAAVVVAQGLGGALALSPDGTTLAFTGRRPTDPVLARGQLYVRRLAELQAAPLAGTNGAEAPFFSPDGQWLAFFADGFLKKVAVTGGAVVTLCEARTPRGGWWAEDEALVFSSLTDSGISGGTIFRVAATGGQPTPVTSTAITNDYSHTWPQALPGGAGILYTATASYNDYENARIAVQPPAGAPKIVHERGYYARYLPSGHLTFVRDGTLFVASFDLERLALTGQPVPSPERPSVVPAAGGALFTASLNGTFAYVASEGADSAGMAPILWLDRSGNTRALRAEGSVWGTARFSPDGRRLAMTMSDRGQQDIWIYDWDRGTSTRLTSDPAQDMVPIWSPDGTRIVFASTRGRSVGQGANLYWQRADSTGPAQRITNSPVSQLPDSWHPNGRVVAYHEGDPRGGRQRIMQVTIAGDEKSGSTPAEPTELVGGPFIKAFAAFSPDGRWLAYVTLESGRPEVYVQKYPEGGTRLQVSSAGGNVPMWSRTRSELYYVTTASAEQQLMAVGYTVDGNEFRAKRPVPLSNASFSTNAPVNNYGPTIDLHPDGERFVIAPANRALDNTTETRVIMVFNGFAELRRLTGGDASARE